MTAPTTATLQALQARKEWRRAKAGTSTTMPAREAIQFSGFSELKCRKAGENSSQNPTAISVKSSQLDTGIFFVVFMVTPRDKASRGEDGGDRAAHA